MDKRKLPDYDVYQEPFEDPQEINITSFYSSKKLKEEALPVGKKTFKQEEKMMILEHNQKLDTINRNYEKGLRNLEEQRFVARNVENSHFNQRMQKLIERHRTRSDLKDEEKPIPFIFYSIEGHQQTNRGGKQACGCISLLAVKYFLYHQESPTDYKWEEIMRIGTVIYTSLIKEGATKSYPDTLEIYDFAKNKFKGLRLKRHICGNLDDSITKDVSHWLQSEERVIGEEKYIQSYSTLDQALTELIATKQGAMIFSVNDYSISICHKNENGKTGIWVFDSHMDPTSPNQECCSLFLFSNRTELAKYIKKKCLRDTKDKKVDVFTATIFSRE